jgi:hypothetical protein
VHEQLGNAQVQRGISFFSVRVGGHSIAISIDAMPALMTRRRRVFDP